MFALGAGEPPIIRQRAAYLEACLLARMNQGLPMSQDRNKFKKYEIDLSRGVFKADGAEDHAAMLNALESIGKLPQWLIDKQTASTPAVATPKGVHDLEDRRSGPLVASQSLPLGELLDKFFLLKKVKPATVVTYKNVVKEFTAFCKSKCPIAEILQSDINRYREDLAKKNNPRTIDNKMIVLKSLINFALDQGYLVGKNPVVAKNLQTKKQKLTDGYAIFEPDEIKIFFQSERFKNERTSDPDYYWCLMLEIFSGCRVGELTALQVGHVKRSEAGTYYLQIRDAKTAAGKREVPIPALIFNQGFGEFLDGKKATDFVFRYQDREGKGAGNAVGKKFSYQIKAEKIHRSKLVFHSLRKFLNDFFMKKLPFKKKNYDEIIAVDARTESNCCFLAIQMTPWCAMPQGGAGAPKWWLGWVGCETKLPNEVWATFHAAPCASRQGAVRGARPCSLGAAVPDSVFSMGS